MANALAQIDTAALLRQTNLQATLVPALAQIDTAALLRQTNLAESLARFDITEALAAHLDFAALLPALDVSRLLPDVSRLLPNVVAGLVPLIDVAALLPRLQLPNFADLLEQLRRDEPPNWPDDIDLDRVTEVIRDDGIPLVWVPRATVVTKVLTAPDRPARVAVLVEHLDEILEDCQAVLADIDEPTLAGQVPLAQAALEAMTNGHNQAGQALAVTVTETAVAAILGRKYEKVKKQVLFDPDLIPYTQLRLRAALAPIYRFYTTWWPSQGTPPPEALSRHVSVHHADVTHYTPENAVLAMLLMTSVLRALQELQTIAAAASGTEAA
jgi:hypothetical protein